MSFDPVSLQVLQLFALSVKFTLFVLQGSTLGGKLAFLLALLLVEFGLLVVESLAAIIQSVVEFLDVGALVCKINHLLLQDLPLALQFLLLRIRLGSQMLFVLGQFASGMLKLIEPALFLEGVFLVSALSFDILPGLGFSQVVELVGPFGRSCLVIGEVLLQRADGTVGIQEHLVELLGLGHARCPQALCRRNLIA